MVAQKELAMATAEGDGQGNRARAQLTGLSASAYGEAVEIQRLRAVEDRIYGNYLRYSE